jgi:colanic acid/amylovoran biosynthesis protein
MKILFINAYSSKNRGDYAIVLAMRDYINKLYPSSTIHVMSSYHEENKLLYAENDLISVPSIWNILNKKLLLKYFEGFILLLKTLFNSEDKIFHEIHEADLICSVGGGYLYSSAKGPLGVGLLNMLFHMWLAKKLKKKLICFPQSVGPIKYTLDKIIVKKIISRVDLFISRENLTTKYLKDELGLQNIIENPDIAFFLKGSSPYPLNLNFNGEKIGITVLNWSFADSKSNFESIENYINKITHTLEAVSRKFDIKVYIFVQVDVSSGDSDYSISKILEKNLENSSIQSEVVRFPENINPKKIIATYGEMDIFVGSRMHSAIFSLDAKVPTIALAYQPKTLGTFKILDLASYVLDIKKFEYNELEKLLIYLIENKSNYNFQKYNDILNSDFLDTHIKKVVNH